MKITQKKIRDFTKNVETFIMNDTMLKPYFTHFKQKIEICDLLYWIVYTVAFKVCLYELNHQTINISKTTLYNFSKKITKLKIFNLYYTDITDKHLNLMNQTNQTTDLKYEKFYANTMLILNKLDVIPITQNNTEQTIV